MFDCIIIGGGISGLYSAYTLLQKKPNTSLLLIEKNDHLGGRIHTVHENGLTFEGGAGRFNDEHVLIMELIKKLKLDHLQIPIKSDIQFIPSTKYDKEYVGKDPFEIMNPVLVKANKEKRSILRKYTFIEYASKHLPSDDIQFLKDAFGYYQQLMDMNAYDALKLFDKGMHTSNSFYVLKGGLSQIINQLHKFISSKCRIMQSTEVVSVNDSPDGSFQILTNKTKTPILGKTCIVALPKPAIQKLRYFNDLKDQIACIGIKSLCRIYSQFAEKDIWFRSIQKTTTNNHNRYIIPIDQEKGLIMISYTDSKYAQYWKKQTKKEMKEKLRKNIEKTFGFTIANPIYTKMCYWDVGTAFWKPNCNSNILSKQIMVPFKNKPIYICGENFSLCQGWMEGALETSQQVVDKIIAELI